MTRLPQATGKEVLAALLREGFALTHVLVSGPFAIYKSPHANGFTLVHLPSQAKIIDLEMQNCCKDAAEKFAALDLNWWTCIPEEVIGPDLQEMRNIHVRLKPTPWAKDNVTTQHHQVLLERGSRGGLGRQLRVRVPL